MNIKTLVVGPIETNCHLVEDVGEVIVVDPGDELGRIMDALSGRNPKLIVCTHYHWDHVSALAGLQHKTQAPLAMGERDAEAVHGVRYMDGHDIARGYAAARVHRRLREGDELAVGDVRFSVIETPGHSPGSICLHCEREGVLFAGDTLFAGGRYGRTDFSDGDFDAIVASMRHKLAKLPDDTRVLCGHGPATSMGAERRLNPYLR